MNIQEYGEYQLRLINDLGEPSLNLAHMAMGIAGEGGEIVDIVKKNFAYGKPLDTEHIVEEIGDLLFYVNGLLFMIDTSWDEVMRVNVAKLEARYPDAKFNADHAINRDVDAEQAAMKGQ